MNTSSSPTTILDLLGAPIEPARLTDAVLLIIDAQREYVDGRLPLVGIDAALAAGGALLRRARAAGTPIVHVLHRGGGPLFNPREPGYQPAAPLIPQAGEAVVEKTLANAFAGTDLHAILERSGRKKLIAIGFMTHNCVSSTVRAARELGMQSTVVVEATATRDLPDGHGGVIPSAMIQAACLAGLADTMARIVRRVDDIQE